MNVRFWLGLWALILSGCAPSQHWVKPGATEADLRTAITLCDRENVHFARERNQSFGAKPAEDVMPTRQSTYRRGAGDMMREECLESHGWRREPMD
jgi:hypothetical protein